MYLRIIEPEVILPPCDYSSEGVAVIGRFSDDISSVLPYLNATQPKPLYNRSANHLRFRFQGCSVTLQPHELAIYGLADADEAIETLTQLQRLINDTWERRVELTPSTVERKRLQALEVYKSLPGLNCKECGESTCFVFANKLTAGQVEVELCTPLCLDPAYTDKKERLMTMLEMAV